MTIALFFTRLTQRVLVPGPAELTATSLPPGTLLRQVDRAGKTAITELAQRASLAA
jgi:hypothetical protein